MTTLPLGASDFDFLIGDWTVHHHRLNRRLAGATDWSDFSGETTLRTLLGGLGNIDENIIELPGGRYYACTLRLFDPATSTWSIYWIDGRDPKPDAPMTGRFDQGMGTFYGDDTFDGRPVRVRFLWSDITPVSARWQQAFSTDGGQTWETNWIMDFRRK